MHYARDVWLINKTVVHKTSEGEFNTTPALLKVTFTLHFNASVVSEPSWGAVQLNLCREFPVYTGS